MLTDPQGLLRLFGDTISDPRGTATRIIALDLPRGVLWQAMLLVTVLSVLLTSLVQGATPSLPTEGSPAVAPLAYAFILGASLVLMVVALYYTGGALGGTGSFGATLSLVVWLEAVAMVVRFVQGLLMLVSPPIGSLFSLLALFVLLWVLVSFIDVLHGYANRLKALMVLFLAVVGIGIGLTIILGLIGVGINGGT